MSACCPRHDEVLHGYVVTARCEDGSEAVDFMTEREVLRLFAAQIRATATALDVEVESVTLHACVERQQAA